MSDATRKAVMRYADAWSAGDVDALDQSLAPEATLWNPRMGELERPRILKHLHRLLTAFPDLGFALDGPVVVEGPRAAYRWVMTGTNTGELYGRPATGNAVRLRGADFVEVTNGLVSRIVEYSDTAAFAEQLAASSR
ncbi:MAG: ester cyclase [Thermoleophilia bacterium]